MVRGSKVLTPPPLSSSASTTISSSCWLAVFGAYHVSRYPSWEAGATQELVQEHVLQEHVSQDLVCNIHEACYCQISDRWEVVRHRPYQVTVAHSYLDHDPFLRVFFRVYGHDSLDRAYGHDGVCRVYELGHQLARSWLILALAVSGVIMVAPRP